MFKILSLKYIGGDEFSKTYVGIAVSARYCRSQHCVNLYTYRFDLQLMSNVQSIKVVLQLSVYMHVVGVNFYNMMLHTLLIMKPVGHITSIFSRLVAFQDQSHVHAHTA